MASMVWQPIEQHIWFRQSGRLLTWLTRSAADLDLPDSFPLPADRPVVLAANHRSLLDLPIAMAVFAKFGLSSRIQVQAAYMRSGVGARFLHSIGAIPTSARHRRASEEASVEAVSKGQLLSIMPEGRLVGPDEWVRGVGRGRPGVSRVALATGAVVVPVGCSGSERVWPRHDRPRVRWPRPIVKVRVGEPVELASKNHEENAGQIMEAIADVLEDLGDPYANGVDGRAGLGLSY